MADSKPCRIGLCVTKSFAAFAALSFITGFTTVTPQLMLPLVGQLAPPHRRATYLSIVVSGLLLGLLVARVLSGVVANFVNWRTIYWIALGLQYSILILLWLFMPDYPSSNPDGLNYFKMLWSIIGYVRREPVLAYACVIGLCTSATFTSFWTTLTFLLVSPPYQYSTLVVGCFAFIGIGAMAFGPPFARLFVDRYHPQLTVIIGECVCLVGHIIGAYTGSFTVAGPILQAFAMDIGLQTAQISNRTMIYSINPKAQNRINTAYMVSVFIGQVTGTAVGNRLYAEGGWIASGSLDVGFIVLALIFCVIKGPHTEGWYGWAGGYSMKRKKPLMPSDDECSSETTSQEQASPTQEKGREVEGNPQPRNDAVAAPGPGDPQGSKPRSQLSKASVADFVRSSQETQRDDQSLHEKA